MLSQSLLFAAGLAGLIAGAEALVRGATGLARSLRVAPLVIGLTVVAFGTSAPEIAVTLDAALVGRADIAVGNVVGSNIVNILFILGISALVSPLRVATRLVRQEIPVMIGASAMLAAMALDGSLGRIEGMLLVSLLLAYTGFLVRQARREEGRARLPWRNLPPARTSWTFHAVLALAGLLLLVLGARWVVEAATSMARAFGISDLVIGLTVVALGTSLPEVAASVAAAARGAGDMAVGNVIGSNVFNLLGCLGLAGLVSPEALPVAPAVLNFDLWIMLAAAFACLAVFATGRRLGRGEGALLLGYYGAYVVYVVLDAQEHDALLPFSTAMLSFVVPLTIVALMVALLRSRAKDRHAEAP